MGRLGHHSSGTSTNTNNYEGKYRNKGDLSKPEWGFMSEQEKGTHVMACFTA